MVFAYAFGRYLCDRCRSRYCERELQGLPLDGRPDDPVLALAKSVIENRQYARLSNATTTGYFGTVHWATAKRLVARQPSAYEITGNTVRKKGSAGGQDR